LLDIYMSRGGLRRVEATGGDLVDFDSDNGQPQTDFPTWAADFVSDNLNRIAAIARLHEFL
jgi:hypothetical protein